MILSLETLSLVPLQQKELLSMYCTILCRIIQSILSAVVQDLYKIHLHEIIVTATWDDTLSGFIGIL
jgi:hypothetical protein